MNVKFFECNGSDLGLFQDIANYKNIVDWIKDIVEQRCYFQPLDCTLKMDGHFYPLMREGKTMDDVTRIIKRIKLLKENVRTLPNDTLLVVANGFERELFLNLDGK